MFASDIPELRLSIMLKNLPIIFPKIPKILNHYSYFIPISSPIIPTYSCNFYCINDNNVHNTHGNCYIAETDVVSANFYSESA